MASITVKIEGLDNLKRKLEALEDAAAADVLEEAVLAGARIVQEDASRRVSKRTGKLARSIEVEVKEKSRGSVFVAVGPTKEAFYGKFVELGHALVRGSKKAKKKVLGHVPARPFLRPAIDENEGKVKRAISNALRAALERVTK